MDFGIIAYILRNNQDIRYILIHSWGLMLQMRLAVFSKFLGFTFIPGASSSSIHFITWSLYLYAKNIYTVLIKSSIFVTKRLVGAIWCLNVTVLFTFAKPYLNFVYHGICRICPIILVLRGSLCFLLQFSWWLVLYCKRALADVSTKALRENTHR